MRKLSAGILVLLLGVAPLASSQDREAERAIQRALIQRDQQSAEFARRSDRLDNLNAQQLRDAGQPFITNPDPEVARQLLPYERQRMTQEREQLPPPADPPKVRPPEKP